MACLLEGKVLNGSSTSGIVGMGEREEVRQPNGSGLPIRKWVQFLALGEPGEISQAST